MQIAVRCLQGFEQLLSNELKELGVQDLKEGRRVVQGTCDLEGLYRVNYCSRLALRVLVPIHSYTFRTLEEFYLNSLDFEWENFLDANTTFAIDPQINSDFFKHAHYASLKIKDAIVDRLRKKLGSRPDINAVNPNVQIHLLVNRDRVQISLDSSGRSLNQRGYRINGGEAPMNEVLAAGMLQLSEWNGRDNFFNPFCGSGTLAIEAAYVAYNWPAQYLNKSFNFLSWKNFSNETWVKVRDEENAKICERIEIEIIGGDIDDKQLSIAWRNLKQLPATDRINFIKNDFFQDSRIHENESVFINPPYGERMELDDLNKIYKELGSVLKHQFNGCEVWIISSDVEALHSIGLRPKKKLKTLNGKLDCEIRGIELFKGSMKEFKTN